MISLAAITFDLSGFIEIDAQPDSEYGELVRRSTRSRTLDGGVTVSDFGFSHGDRDFIINFTPTEAEDESMRYLVEYYDQLHIGTAEGFFKAIPSYKMQRGVATINLQITEKIA